ncbi:helix-turn-helix transcriptional regulator [Pectobacterium polonicum]|uniref:Helix-turn-helix domain-containing protein n=1 Tax=Pectobacterium polonicum TaxID=2485124 RepID=A0AAE9NP60_9GAMM|nr:helix-turn-helix domain-containing protein [Pectobacterium polonicum]MDC9821700.1 helix-turn-helix domain-containing protein [Pectobacterium polonicum]TKY81176.1 transcriptional regulator [Pectobacterium polonicum]UVO08429.1 helix-turn-helix transcriptional regulator [Pectobacterium polonicum]
MNQHPTPIDLLPPLLPTGNVLAEKCPSRQILNHVTSRWGVLILIALLDDTHRFSQLRRRIGGVSERMLAQTLQWLESDGFVLRTAYPVVPPHVEYSLTPLGKEVGERVKELAVWIEGNLGDILAAQQSVEKPSVEQLSAKQRAS